MKQKKFIIIGLVILLSIVIKIKIDNKRPEWRKEFYNKIILNPINGRISKKFKNREHHMHKTIEVKGIEYIFTRDISGFYDFVEVGDSVYKNDSSSFIKVYRDTNDYIFALKFDFKQ